MRRVVGGHPRPRRDRRAVGVAQRAGALTPLTSEGGPSSRPHLANRLGRQFELLELDAAAGLLDLGLELRGLILLDALL